MIHLAEDKTAIRAKRSLRKPQRRATDIAIEEAHIVRRPPSKSTLLTEDEFQKALQLERLFAGRENQTLVVLQFDRPRDAMDWKALRKLSETFGYHTTSQVRIGWLANDKVGMIVRHVSPQLIRSAMAGTIHKMHLAGSSSELTLYSFPSRLTPTRSSQTDPIAPLFMQPIPTWKRCMDVCISAIALVALLPFFALVAIAIKLTSVGPVIFKQQRSGLGGKTFGMYKFRSMSKDAEAKRDELQHLNVQDGPAFKVENDPRVTSLGRWLRKTSIDELPQLWNVLKGEMSLVGPRPLPCQEMDDSTGWQHQRLDVTPGLTCFWQVHGRKGITFDEWVRLDIRYIQRESFLTDLYLLVATIPAVLFCRGAK